MITETEIYKDYTINIAVDKFPTNPFEDDCYPPMMIYYDKTLTNYGEFPDIENLINLIPSEKMIRGERIKTIKELLDIDIWEFAQHKNYTGYDDRKALADLFEEKYPKSRYYSDILAHFDALEILCKIADIPYYYSECNIGSQDFVLVFIIATPEWIKKVGVLHENLENYCKSAFQLFEDWSCGNCFGISSIENPDGNEIEESSIWGFYGSNHEKSGLMDCARKIIEYDINKKEKKNHLITL